MRLTTTLAALAVAASMLAAGCGGTSATLSDRQFDDRAGAVCQDMWRRLDSATGSLARTLPIVDAAVASLRGLAPPLPRRPAVARWLRSYDDLLAALRRIAAAGQGPGSWEELAPVLAAAEDAAWDVGAYRCAGPETTAPPTVAPVTYDATSRDVVIDTDMGADDWLAILYLLARPDVTVRAITVSGTGLAHCGPGARNARGLLALAGKRAPVACGRVACGRERAARAFPRAWRRSADDLLGLTLPREERADAGAPASELIAAAVRAAPGDVSLLALGPLTNVADAFARHPGLPRQLGRVVVMGGALAVPGNAPGGRAEWNFAADPSAAAAVLGAGAPVTLVPLDATRAVPVERSFYEGLKAARHTPVARFAFDVLTRRREQIDAGGMFFWDPLAAAILTGDVASLERRRVRVATRGALAGWTAVAGDGAAVRVAGAVDRARFERLFLSVIASRPEPH